MISRSMTLYEVFFVFYDFAPGANGDHDLPPGVDRFTGSLSNGLDGGSQPGSCLCR